MKTNGLMLIKEIFTDDFCCWPENWIWWSTRSRARKPLFLSFCRCYFPCWWQPGCLGYCQNCQIVSLWMYADSGAWRFDTTFKATVFTFVCCVFYQQVVSALFWSVVQSGKKKKIRIKNCIKHKWFYFSCNINGICCQYIFECVYKIGICTLRSRKSAITTNLCTWRLVTPTI